VEGNATDQLICCCADLRLPGAARRQPDSIRWGVVSDRIYSSTTVRGGGGRRVHQWTLLPHHLRAQQQRHSHPCGLVQHELRRLRSCDWLADSDGAFPVAAVPGGPCQRLPRDLLERRPRQGQVQDRHDVQLQPRHHPVHQHPVTQAHSRRWQRPRARCVCSVPGHHSGG
jgi:hypothetical protein